MTRRKDPAAVSLGRRGGAAATPAQAAASRINARKGGRPMGRASIERAVEIVVRELDRAGHGDLARAVAITMDPHPPSAEVDDGGLKISLPSMRMEDL